MASTASTPANRAIDMLMLRVRAIRATSKKIRQAREADIFDSGYANAKLDDLSDRLSDLSAEITAIGLGNPVTNAPSSEQIEAMAVAVGALRIRNVTEATARDIVRQGFTLAGIVLGDDV